MAACGAMDYERATREFLYAGPSVFQGAMLADTESEHCRILFDLVQPSGTVVDMGCGIGGVLHDFKCRDPNLEVIGVTNSALEVEHALPGVKMVLADMTETGLPDGCADLVMFCESFGYAPARRLLDEAYRLLKPGGRLFIKDFAFQAHSPVIGQCEARRGYTVHDPDALTIYAEKSGFRAVRQWRRVPADFSRWHRFMDGYTAADDHRHPSHGPNICVALYLYEKPAEAAARPSLTMREALQGDEDAIDFCDRLYKILHVWDDIVDGDKPLTAADVNGAFRAALVDLPMNRFFRKHADTLVPILSAGITAWEVSNVFERSDDRELWRKAHMLRVHVGAVFVMCAELVGGREWATQVAPSMYDLVQGDTLAQYLDEMERKHAA